MKKLIGVLVVSMILAFGIVGCGAPTVDDKQTAQTQQLMNQSNSKLGLPNIKNFYEKKMMKEIMEAADDSNLITYAYLQNKATGKLVYLGEAMGYGLPYGTEYTNPEYIAWANGGSSASHTLPQPDPNGLYKAQNVAATWLILIDPKTKQAKPIYCEPDLMVSPFKLPKNLVDPTTLPSDY